MIISIHTLDRPMNELLALNVTVASTQFDSRYMYKNVNKRQEIFVVNDSRSL